jgi:hypothetical protein
MRFILRTIRGLMRAAIIVWLAPIIGLGAAGMSAGAAPPAAATARMNTIETITHDGTPWVASTWGYNTPKLLFDGNKVYAVALVGSGIDHDVARLYARDEAGHWRRGADLAPVYQPATLLLDDRGFINVFTTRHMDRACAWRSRRPGDVSAFDPVSLPKPEQFGYGYLGVGRSGSLVALAGLDHDYAMWLTVKRSFDAPWEAPIKIADSQKAHRPWTSPVYPIVLPDPAHRAVDVVFCSSPDGGIHNTYDRVELARINLSDGSTKVSTVAHGPVGEMTFGMDAVRTSDGAIHIIYMSGLHVYGAVQPDEQKRHGVFCASSHDGTNWSIARVSESTGTSQLSRRPDDALMMFQTTSVGTDVFRSRDDQSDWKKDPAPIWTSPGAFLYVIKANSGSVMGDFVRAVQSQPIPDAPPDGVKYGLSYLTAHYPGGAGSAPPAE